MSKTWGIARLYGVGSMEYLLESEDWLADSKLFDGAPLLLFETMEEADVAAKALRTGRNAHGVQFIVDSENRVLTWKSAKAKSLRRPNSRHGPERPRNSQSLKTRWATGA